MSVVTGGPAACTSACWPALLLAGGPPSAVCGTSASCASGRRSVPVAVARRASAVGRVKLGGMASGARVVTVNSSGASWLKPRCVLRSVSQPASIVAQAGQA